MDQERYKELSVNVKLRLTDDELDDGWFFCHCEWDGLLVHESHPEAEFCRCRKSWREKAKG